MDTLTHDPSGKPLSFKQWVALREPGHRAGDHCESCGEHPAFGDHEHCEACLRYGYGYDQAQFATATAMIAGAVESALADGVNAEILALAVTKAIRSYDAARADAFIAAIGARR